MTPVVRSTVLSAPVIAAASAGEASARFADVLALVADIRAAAGDALRVHDLADRG